MDFQLPTEDDPRRLVVREWIKANPKPSGSTLAKAGYVAPHWPAPWGLEADPIHQLIIDDELNRAAVRRPTNPIGIGWAGPTLLYAGTQEQKDRYLDRLLSGEDFWCQLFSEPGSGSDLASLGTRALRDGDEFIVNGQKIWTSGAQHAKYGILIARTDPDLPKHKGISYFVCPMDAPGMSLSTGGVLWGNGPTALEMLDAVRANGPVTDVHMRQRLASIYIEHMVLDLIRLRTLSAKLRGEQPGPEASIRKIMADEHGQHVMAVARDLLGASGMLTSSEGREGFVPGTDTKGLGPGRPPDDLGHPGWYDGYMFSQALTIGGGTGDVQRNIVAERVLGLPHDIDVQIGLTWAETQRSGSR